MKKQTKKTRRGLVLYLVIVIMALAGSALYLLTRISNGMANDAHRTYLQACQRNMIAAAAAWADHNVELLSDRLTAGPIVLDTDDLRIPKSSLTITGKDPNGSTAQVEIQAQCSKGRLRMRKTAIHAMSP